MPVCVIKILMECLLITLFACSRNICVSVSKFVCLWVCVSVFVNNNFFNWKMWLTSNWIYKKNSNSRCLLQLIRRKTSVCMIITFNSGLSSTSVCMPVTVLGINQYKRQKLYCQQQPKKLILPIHSSSHSSFKKVSTWIIVSLKMVSKKRVRSFSSSTVFQFYYYTSSSFSSSLIFFFYKKFG